VAKEYDVAVSRAGYGYCSFKVEAINQEEAENKALVMAHNTSFSEKSSDYRIESVGLSSEDTEGLVEQTLVETNLGVLKAMVETWAKHMGVGTRVHYWLTKTIEELEDRL
jgi:hypothetical protein